MARVLVAGLINIETTLKIERFPIGYTPVRFPFFGIQSTVSGVGYNISSALTKLGHDVRFCALIGTDDGGSLVTAQLHADRIAGTYVRRQLEQTPQSVILYDADGRRAINTDLKDIQDQLYPVESFEQALSETSLAVLCNINFARPMLDRTRQAGIPIATDVHTIADLNDTYNRDYMANATILFQSHEKLPVPPEDWARLLWNRYGTPIIVIGLGAEGALLAVKDDRFVERIPAVYTRPVVSTIGAGDALFSGFVHTYIHTGDPYLAIKKGVVYASYKIGAASAAQGLLNAAELDEWTTRVYSV